MIKNIGIVEEVRLWDGCQSYWKLDETSGTIVTDSVGGNNGVASNADMRNASGKNNYCVSTASRYVDFGSAFKWSGLQPYSISFWTKNINTANSVGLLIANTDSGGNSWIGMYYTPTDGNIYNNIQKTNAANRCGTGVSAAIPKDTTSWTHVCFTYNGTLKASGCTWYINGVLKTQLTPTDTLTSTDILGTNFQIGRNYTTTYQGSYVDEVALWNRALNSAEVKALYSNGNGKFYGTKALSFKDLIHYWNFNEISGTTVYDRKGAYNGTLTSAAARTTAGKSFSGMTFTSGHYCSYGTPFTWTAAQPYSVSAWVKASANPTPVIPILSNLDNTTSGTIDIYININNINFGLFYNNSTGRCFCTANGKITDTNWHHILCTYNGSSSAYGMQIYLDGVAVGAVGTNTLTYTGNLGATLYTNRRYTTNYDNASIVDEIAIFNKALTKDDAVALYNAGNGIYY